MAACREHWCLRNLKAAVIQFRKDDTPILNEALRGLKNHYRLSVLPARPRKPKDMSKAESGVLLTQRRILAPLRNVVFHSLPELNAAILKQVQAINAAPFQELAGGRQSLFEELDKPALRMMPPNRYEYGE